VTSINRKASRPARTSPVKVDRTTTNHMGATAYALDPVSDLYTLGTTFFMSEKTWHENADSRTRRVIALSRQTAHTDRAWLFGFLPFLRHTAGMRTGPIVMAAEAAHELITSGNGNGVADMIDSVIKRADEPGIFLAYWCMRFQDGPTLRLPQAVKKGLAKAARRVYTQYAVLKWDKPQQLWRAADVIAVSHPRPVDHEQGDLFQWIRATRRGNTDAKIPKSLKMARARRKLYSEDLADRYPMLLTDKGRAKITKAGMTWQNLSGWLEASLDHKAWDALITSGMVGYQAALMNLRQMDEARITDATADTVCRMLSDPEHVRKTGIMPYQILTASLNTFTHRWGKALSDAMDNSITNIPALPGRTLVLIDSSSSMLARLSRPDDGNYRIRSGYEPVHPTRSQVAALFGIGVAVKAHHADTYGWSTAGQHWQFHIPKGGSVLALASQFMSRVRGGGTDMAAAIRDTYNGHDRVVILSDFQAFEDTHRLSTTERTWYRAENETAVNAAVPAHIPVYAFDTTGHGTTMIKAGTRNRYQIGGLTDHSFTMIRDLERGHHADWPWQTTS
jgi:hypothetical protein